MTTSPRSQATQLSLATSCNHSAGSDFHHGSSQMADGSEICWAAANRENLSPIFGKVYISYISAVVGSTFSCCSLSNVVDFKLVWPSNRICLWRQLQTFMKVPIRNFYSTLQSPFPGFSFNCFWPHISLQLIHTYSITIYLRIFFVENEISLWSLQLELFSTGWVLGLGTNL